MFFKACFVGRHCGCRDFLLGSVPISTAFEEFDWLFSLSFLFSLSVSAPGREGHLLYAGRAGLPQVQHWISFHEGTNQGSTTGASA